MKTTTDRYERGKAFGEELVKNIPCTVIFASNAIPYYKSKSKFVKADGKDYHDWYDGIISVLEKRYQKDLKEGKSLESYYNTGI